MKVMRLILLAVVAVIISGCSGPRNNLSSVISKETSGTPTAPLEAQDLQTIAGDSYIIVNWTAPNHNGAITNYRIYRGTTPGKLALLTTVGNVLTYNDTSVTKGENYFYRIIAVYSEDPVQEVTSRPIDENPEPNGLIGAWHRDFYSTEANLKLNQNYRFYPDGKYSYLAEELSEEQSVQISEKGKYTFDGTRLTLISEDGINKGFSLSFKDENSFNIAGDSIVFKRCSQSLNPC